MSRAEGDKKYYSITEVAEQLNVNPSLLRYWESVLPGINPKRNKKGTRFYTRENIEHLTLLHFLVKEKGYTLKAVAEQLKSRKKNASPQYQVKKTLEDMRSFLVELRAQIGNQKP